MRSSTKVTLDVDRIASLTGARAKWHAAGPCETCYRCCWLAGRREDDVVNLDHRGLLPPGHRRQPNRDMEINRTPVRWRRQSDWPGWPWSNVSRRACQSRCAQARRKYGLRFRLSPPTDVSYLFTVAAIINC